MQEQKYDLNRKMRPIVIIPPRESWREEFLQIGTQLRSFLSEHALRIDHIGSTSVPDMGAKDIIDIQITVHNLDKTDEFA